MANPSHRSSIFDTVNMSNIDKIIGEYFGSLPGQLTALGSAGGFSGAQLGKLTIGTETYCVRRWPTPHPSFRQLSWIHRVLLHACVEGCDFVAAPIRSLRGETITKLEQALWEVAPWKPGTADFLSDPNDQRLANMIQAVARFHLASAQVSLDFSVSQNLTSRIEQLTSLPSVMAQINSAGWPRNVSETNAQLIKQLASFREIVVGRAMPLTKLLLTNLQHHENQLFAVQPIIRDIWHDHVLFSGNEVTGLVDFGAMQMDNVMFDLARLLGSTIGNEPGRWAAAIQYYSEIRPLRESELALLPWLDQSGILLGCVNWLKWILLDQRQFEDWNLVAARIEFLRGRLTGTIGLSLN